MKTICFVLIFITVICAHAVECKLTRRNHGLKKAAAQLKPTKSPKTIVDAFSGLPAEDIEFIRQLDKQFNKFGGNVKIKVQKENRTTSKNTKRTIEGSLAYGYQNSNDQQSGYSFSKPKYEVYPYSQQDIAPSQQYHQSEHSLHYLRNYPQALVESDPHYYQKQAEHTSVEIQPSHSYEIKQTENGYRTVYSDQQEHVDHSAYQQEHVDHSAYQPEGSQGPTSGDGVPVIVLRVPGPAKYASHLQALLQQYLEVRAAQYLQAIQEHDTQHVHDNAQYHNVEAGVPVIPYVQQQAYIAAPMLVHPVQPVHFAGSLPDPYQHSHEPHVETGEGHIIATPSPASYYKIQPNEEPHSGVVHPTSYEYHNVHAGADYHHPHHGHVQNAHEQIIYGRPHQESVAEHDQLLTTENFPSDKHTQVIFKTTTAAPYHGPEYDNTQVEHEHEHQHEQHEQHDHHSHYLAPQTYQAPLVYHKLEHYYNGNPSYDEQSNAEHVSNENAGYDSNAQPIESSVQHSTEEVIPITQRPAVLPNNYHSQLAQLAHYSDESGYDYQSPSYDDNLYKRSSNKKRQSSRNDRYKKFANLAQRMKTRMAAVKETNNEQTTA